MTIMKDYNRNSDVSRSSSSENCTGADKILSDMTKSFTTFKGTTVFDFYDSTWNKINWGICGAYATAGSHNTSNTAATSSDSSIWLSSLDFLKTINLQTLSNLNMKNRTSNAGVSTAGGTAVGDSSTGQSSLDVVYDRLGNLSNQLVYENRLVKEVSKQITDSFNRNLQITTTGVLFGALLGSAIATGVIIGTIATTSAIANSEYVPLLYKRVLRFWNRVAKDHMKKIQDDTEKKEEDLSKDESSESITGASFSSSSVSTGSTVIVQGNPTGITAKQTADEQCRTCLQGVAHSLESRGLTWRDVHRVTAYLVTGKCDGATFRHALAETTTTENNDKSSSQIVSVLFVQQLENEDAILQVEVLASKDGKLI